MQFYVIEIQNRADGNNNQSTTMRKKLSTGLQLFYERCAANVQTQQYPTATVMLIDSEGNVYKNERIVTSYVEPEQEGA
jgi:hypothetical protein